jgi:cytochrome c oxidase assembly protein subunit 15
MTQAARKKLGGGARGRAIFEEVSGPSRAPVAAPGEADRIKARARRWVAGWLMALAALVSAMVLVGGMTRLTDSGLSMVGWHPVLEAIPPLTAEDWAREFERYQQTAQYRLVNSWMTVEDFKPIFWWEWGHRQFGRVIGLVWAVGLLIFAIRRMIPRGYWGWVIVPGLLGGVQAVVGWWMVYSGVAQGSELVSVAPYRLTVHLGLAFLILGLLIWPAWRLQRTEVELLQARRRRSGGVLGGAGVLVALCFVQILLGALVAGNDAGRGYTDWPLMNGAVLPPESFELMPLWRNFIENAALVQFNHRVAGYVLLLWALIWAGWARRPRLPGLSRWGLYALLIMLAQAAWGVVTVLHGAPLAHALAHQAGAIATLAVVLRARFEAAYPQDASLRG